MAIFTVDADRCVRDGICAEVCPGSLIDFPGGDGLPAPVGGADSLCINCGHCVAVCPYGALSLLTMKAADCPPVQSELLPAPDQVEQLFLSRRSIRSFREEAVDRGILARLIDIARHAPSAHNAQPVHWLVVEDREEVQRLAALTVDWMRHVLEHKPDLARGLSLDRVVKRWEEGRDPVCRHAPHLVLAHAPKTAMSPQVACTIALTHLELAASALGLGACWAGYLTRAAGSFSPLLEALDLPAGHQAYGGMLIGYPRYQYHRIPLRNRPPVTWR